MKEDSKDSLYTFFALAVIALVVVWGGIKAYPHYVRFRALKGQIAERDALIREKEDRLSKIAEMQRRFQTDSEFVEAVARQNHRYYPGELVFVFENEGRR